MVTVSLDSPSCVVTLFDPVSVVYRDATRQAKGLYHLKYVGALRSGLAYLSRYNSGWFCHTRILRRSKGFVLVDGKLYRRGARSGVLIKCLTKEDGYDILREIHEGVCGNHAASRTLVGKAYRTSFWWPTAVTDVEDLMRRCQNCQFFGKQTHVPAHSLITIPPS
jgi:hypothetical protein